MNLTWLPFLLAGVYYITGSWGTNRLTWSDYLIRIITFSTYVYFNFRYGLY